MLNQFQSQAVKRFLTLECSLHSEHQFDAFNVAMEDYFEMEHAEPVPMLNKSQQDAFYQPMHAESSTTTRVHSP